MPVAWAFPTLWYLICGWRNGSNEYSFPIPLYKFSVRKILFSLISCFAYTIQLRKNIKLIVGQRKSHLQRMEAKVYTGRDMMTLCKKDSCDFRKLDKESYEVTRCWSCSTSFITLSVWIQVSYICPETMERKVQVQVIFWLIRFWRGSKY